MSFTYASRPQRVIFLDWKMPQMDGVEVARQLMAWQQPRQLLVMMVTAHERESLENAAAGLDIGAILEKPVVPSHLRSTLMQLLRPQAHVASTQEDADSTAPHADALRGFRALLVEDNDVNQEVAVALLQDLGLEVEVADNGAAALGRIQQRQYDVVLMDIHMPVMDGIEATRRIRALSSAP